MEKKDKECCEECGGSVESLKENYEVFQKKYSLPSFKELNEEFDIGKLDCDTETILRDIRKSMVLKFSSTLQFTELLLNPSNGSMFHMFLVKGINGDNKEDLNKLFENLGSIEIESFSRDITYNEKEEANFINRNFKSWKELKPPLEKIMKSLKDNWKKTAQKKGKSYFG